MYVMVYRLHLLLSRSSTMGPLKQLYSASCIKTKKKCIQNGDRISRRLCTSVKSATPEVTWTLSRNATSDTWRYSARDNLWTRTTVRVVKSYAFQLLVIPELSSRNDRLIYLSGMNCSGQISVTRVRFEEFIQEWHYHYWESARQAIFASYFAHPDSCYVEKNVGGDRGMLQLFWNMRYFQSKNCWLLGHLLKCHFKTFKHHSFSRSPPQSSVWCQLVSKRISNYRWICLVLVV